MAKILIVDNELSLVADLETRLVRAGHRILGCAVAGPQALALAREAAPELVLMEIKLTGAIDGVTVAIRIKQTTDIPIIFMTWYADSRTRAEAMWAHPAAFLVKPLSWRELHAAIDAALAGKAIEGNSMPASMPPCYGRAVGVRTREPAAGKFTPAENRVIALIVQGCDAVEIGRRLNLKETTVHWHQKNIRRNMGLTGTKKNLISVLGMERL
jgi:DNA-binding NarL/FixJ family response regulator